MLAACGSRGEGEEEEAREAWEEGMLERGWRTSVRKRKGEGEEGEAEPERKGVGERREEGERESAEGES
eukprot:1888236-Rhodomonas_salina.1